MLTGPLSMNDRAAGDPRGDSHILSNVHSANEYFLEIVKDYTFSALYGHRQSKIICFMHGTLTFHRALLFYRNILALI